MLTLTTAVGVLCAAVSTGALLFAGGRLGALAASSVAERALTAAIVAGALAVAMSLGLGIVDLGSSQTALTLVSLALAAASLTLPAPRASLSRQLLARWETTGPNARIAIGAVGGVVALWALFSLLRPTLDLDSAYYNLPQISGWIAEGNPGSIQLVSFYYPIGNYPLTNEVLMTWSGSVSGNMGVLLLWPLAAGALLAGGIYTTLRALGSDVRLALVAVAVTLTIPVVTESLTSMDSDLPSMAWGAAVVALSVRVATGKGSPGLIPFAVLGLGLALGTKTTVAPICLAALGFALYRSRRELRLWPIAAAVLGAVAVGGVWYLRNWIDHGNPLWPFTSIPGSDPLPETLDYLSAPFISSPLDTLDGRIGEYFDRLGAGILLILAGMVLPFFTGVKRLWWLGGAVALSLLLWMVAPATGEPPGPDGEIFQVSGARYLMASIVLAIGVVTFLAWQRGRTAAAAKVVLGAALAWGAVSLAMTRDGVPPGWMVLAALLVGAALASGVGVLRVGRPLASGLAVAAALVVAVGLAAYPDSFLNRFASAAEQAEDPLEDASLTYDELAVWFDNQDLSLIHI